MGAAQRIWDAAKHPRGAHGRFGAGSGARIVKEPGKAPKRAAAWERKGLLPGHSMASATTGVFASKASGHKRSITKFEPGVHSAGGRYLDSRGKYVFKTAAGFEQVGVELQPSGYVAATLDKRRAAEARSLMARGHRYRSRQPL